MANGLISLLTNLVKVSLHFNDIIFVTCFSNGSNANLEVYDKIGYNCCINYQQIITKIYLTSTM